MLIKLICIFAVCFVIERIIPGWKLPRIASRPWRVFYHTSIKTPHWVGYFFQRLEMHRVHHEMDRHRINYGDIVWWDMLSGTYDNRRTFEGQCSFAGLREERLKEMLCFKDVHQ